MSTRIGYALGGVSASQHVGNAPSDIYIIFLGFYMLKFFECLKNRAFQAKAGGTIMPIPVDELPLDTLFLISGSERQNRYTKSQ